MRAAATVTHHCFRTPPLSAVRLGGKASPNGALDGPRKFPATAHAAHRVQGSTRVAARNVAPLHHPAMAALASPFLHAFGIASEGCMSSLRPSLVVSYLQACAQSQHRPPSQWLSKLYTVWEACMSTTDVHLTVDLLSALTSLEVDMEGTWIEAVYFQVGHNQHSLRGKDVVTFLEAARYVLSPRPDRDLILGLSQHLLSAQEGRSTMLESMAAADVARLMVALAANGQPPGVLMAAAALRVLATAAAAGQLEFELLVEALEAVALSAGPVQALPLCPDVAALSLISATVSGRLASTAADHPILAVRCLSALSTCRMAASSLPAVCAVLQPMLHQLPPKTLCSLVVSLQRAEYVPTQEWGADFHSAVGQQLGKFQETDELVELLKALQDMGLSMGFSFLNKLADRVAARSKSMAPPPATTEMPPLISPAALIEDSSTEPADLEAAVCLYLLANLNHKPGYERIQMMLAGLQPQLTKLPSLHLTNTLWSLARLGHPVETPFLLDARVAVAHQQSLMLSCSLSHGALKPYQLAFVFGSLQTLRCPMDTPFVDQMLECVAHSLPAMTPHDVALVLGTVARLKHLTSYTWMAAVEEHVSLRLEVYTPKELVTVVWAMAKLHHRPSAEWTAAFQDGCFETMDAFKPGNLATLVWSFSELRQPPDTLWMDTFCSTSRTQLDSMAPQDLASLLPSFARLGYQPDPSWLTDYLTVVHAHLPALNGEGFAAVVKGLQDLDARVSGREFWDAFCLAMRPRLSTMSHATLVDVAVGLAASGYKPGSAWASTYLQVCEKTRDAFSPDELNHLVCALAALKTAPTAGLLKVFLSRTPAVLPTLEPERITAAASALAVIWSLPAEATACTPDDASPYLESLVQAARGNIHSFGLIQLNDLTKALLELQDQYTKARGGSPSHSPLSDFLEILQNWN